MSQRDSSEAEGESSEPVPKGASPAKTTAPTAPTPPPYSNGHPATRQGPMTVSYTHLTLPTILLV